MVMLEEGEDAIYCNYIESELVKIPRAVTKTVSGVLARLNNYQKIFSSRGPVDTYDQVDHDIY
jgi:hypothetical protein